MDEFLPSFSCPAWTWTQVKLVEQGLGYLMLSGLITTILALLPLGFYVAQQLDVSSLGSLSLTELGQLAVGSPDAKTCAFFFITTVQRVCLTGLLFFMMCVAERTYKQVFFSLLWVFTCICRQRTSLWLPEQCSETQEHVDKVNIFGLENSSIHPLYIASINTGCSCLSSLIETFICQVLQPHHFSSQGQKVRDPSFPAEKSAEHKDVAISTLFPESWYSDALDELPRLECPACICLSFNPFVLQRRGPQRSVDVIVSTVFLLALSVSVIICAQVSHVLDSTAGHLTTRFQKYLLI